MIQRDWFDFALRVQTTLAFAAGMKMIVVVILLDRPWAFRQQSALLDSGSFEESEIGGEYWTGQLYFWRSQFHTASGILTWKENSNYLSWPKKDRWSRYQSVHVYESSTTHKVAVLLKQIWDYRKYLNLEWSSNPNQETKSHTRRLSENFWQRS